MAKINELPLLSNPTGDMYCLVGNGDLQKVPWSAIQGQIGAPYIAKIVSEMTDKTRVYVYTGSESGYTSGNWYYWNGSAWTSGGVYNSQGIGPGSITEEMLSREIKFALSEGDVTTDKIEDGAVTSDKVNFTIENIFDFVKCEIQPDGKYKIPWIVGQQEELYMVYTSTLQTEKRIQMIKTDYARMYDSSQNGNYAVKNIGVTKGETIWSIPEICNSFNYPWKTFCKFTFAGTNQYFSENNISGNQYLFFETIGNPVVYDGDNYETAELFILNQSITKQDYENKFETTAELDEKIKNYILMARSDILNDYNVQDYGISTQSADNSLKLRQLMEKVAENGGGRICFPSGTYKFDTSNSDYIVGSNGCKCVTRAYSNVSIHGESLTDTVLKMTGNSSQGVCMFGYNNSDKIQIEGCIYDNFTIDGSEATIDTYSSDGKAFFFQYVKNCVWRDLRLIGTPATSLGIDYLDNVVIDSVYCYQSGRIHTEDSPGGAGIGIGTGAWENENFIIRNCICDSCGHFGIFLEDQSIFEPAHLRTPRYPKGAIIANNICRNGRNYGFGLRGGQNVVFNGNIAYENKGGFFADYVGKRCVIENNMFFDNTEAGIKVVPEDSLHPFSIVDYIFMGNQIYGNDVGVIIGAVTEGSVFKSNIIKGNTTYSINMIVQKKQTALLNVDNIIQGDKVDLYGDFD